MSLVRFSRSGALPRPARGIARAIVVLSIAASLVACAGTAKIEEVQKFADAGIAFSDAMPPLYDESLKVTVETDSLVLEKARPNLPDRLAALEQSKKLLLTRIEVLDDLKRHGGLLRQYFAALRTLASSDAPTEIGAATSDLVRQLVEIDNRLVPKSIGPVPIRDHLEEAATFAARAYQAAALNRELKANAETIDRELNLQQAALSALAEAMKADLETQMANEELERIVRPYVADKPLPSDWSARRLDAYKKRISLGSAEAAADAARNLRATFAALVERRLDGGGISMLIQDVKRVVAFVDSLRPTNKSEK